MSITDAELDVLVRDYEISREDERTAHTTTTALAGVGAALFAGIVAIMIGDCRFKSDECYSLPDPVLSLVPTLLIVLLTYVVLLSLTGTTRTFYMRSLEAEIRQRTSLTLSAAPSVSAPSAIELSMSIVSPYRGRQSYRILLAVLIAGCVLSLVGIITIILANVALTYTISFGAFYAILLTLVVREILVANLGGRALMQRAIAVTTTYPYPGVDIRPRPPTRVAPADERTLLSYLLLPRTQEIVKFAFIPVAFLVGSLLPNQVPPTGWSVALALWLIFEYGCYQARYQWNDIRGVASDQSHPSKSQRGRLPMGKWGGRISLAATSAVAVARLAGFIILTMLLGAEKTVSLLLAGVAAWLLAILYEYSRGNNQLPDALKGRTTWLLAGGGYGLRMYVGLLLAGVTPPEPSAIFLIAGTWFFGIQFVLMGWLLEAVGHCSGATPNIKFFRRSMPGNPRPSLGQKPHLLDLVKAAGIDARPTLDPAFYGTYRDREPVLLARGGMPTTPWQIAAILASALLSSAFAVAADAPIFSWIPTVAATAGTATLVCLTSQLRRNIVASLTIAVTAALAYLFIPPFLATGTTVAVAVCVSTYVFYSKATYADLRDSTENLRLSIAVGWSTIRETIRRLGEWVIGKRAADYVRAHP